MTGETVRVERLRFAWGADEMVFDLEVEAGAIAAVIGPSGAGKSTLLNLIAGFETPLSGAVRIGGADVTRLPLAARPISMVFQENNLFAHLDATTNVGLGLSPFARLTRDERARVEAALARVGLADLGARLPGELSGGERQRVALARVLVRERPVLLLDEPFVALGPALRADMLDLLADLHAERGMTVLMVTHQPGDARRLATHTAFLYAGRVRAYRETAALFSATDLPALDAYLGASR